METIKKEKITLELDPTQPKDLEIIKFLEKATDSMKKNKFGSPVSKSEVLKALLSTPTKKTSEIINRAFINGFTEADKLNAILASYNRINNLDISLADFSLNYLGNLKNKERQKLIKQSLQ